MPILHWLTREQDLHASGRAPFRLLEHVETYGEADSQNMLIQGDNLDALKALLPYYAGKVKCIYIDPPYNTKSAFEHYDDNLEHGQWLSMMYPRLELLRELLSEDGLIMISINDDEAHYLKVICDEIFGRKNFVTSLVWNTEGNTDNQAAIINYHEYIILYTKSDKILRPNVIDINTPRDSKLFNDEIRNTVVKNGPKNPISEIIIPVGFPCAIENGVILKKNIKYPIYSDDIYIEEHKLVKAVVAKSGWSSKKILENFVKSNFMPVPDSKKNSTSFEISKSGAIEAFKPRIQNQGHFISVLRNLGTTNQMRITLSKMGLKFSYPKPLVLIKYLVDAFTNRGDIVLDSFAGSGTTAHATLNFGGILNRRFIIIERNIGTAKDIIIPRLLNVIKGHSKAEVKATGGGFRFYRLGEPIFAEDGSIRKDITFTQLAAHVWFAETGIPMQGEPTSPLLGIHEGTACYLLYNGILGDKKANGGNVLTNKILHSLAPHDGPKIIYGERSLFTAERLKAQDIVFKQTPYDIKGR